MNKVDNNLKNSLNLLGFESKILDYCKLGMLTRWINSRISAEIIVILLFRPRQAFI